MTSSQVGKTSALLSIVGHRFGDGPRVPALMVMETQTKAKQISTERVRQLIRDCPQLAELHDAGKNDSIYERYIGGVAWRMAWAGSAGALASHSIGLLLADEIERWPGDVGGEGDPLRIVKARTITYKQSLTVVTSSPTTEDECRIQDEFDQGSMEVAEWACQHCGHYHRPLLSLLRWPKEGSVEERALAATYACPSCGAAHFERDKRAMIDSVAFRPYQRKPNGDYVPNDDRTINHRHRSFWISGFHSPFLEFREIAFEMISAYGSNDENQIRGAVNTIAGELWRSVGDRPEADAVRAHMIEYRRGERPFGIQYVTVGVDVQRDRLFYVVRGWGCQAGPKESWLIEEGQCYGDPAYDPVWLLLDDVLKRHQPNQTWIDVGWKPTVTWSRPDHMVHNYCERRTGVYPCRGVRYQQQPISLRKVDITVGGMVRKSRHDVRFISVNTVRTELYGWIRSNEYDQADVWHLHSEISDDYAEQVVADEWIPSSSGEGRYHCPRHRPNHWGDCEVYATAAVTHHLQNHRMNPIRDTPENRARQSKRTIEPPKAAAGFGRPSAFG